MAFDPEELVTLTDHGTMKLHSAVSRAMTMPPKERKRATIVREGDPAILTWPRNMKRTPNIARRELSFSRESRNFCSLRALRPKRWD